MQNDVNKTSYEYRVFTERNGKRWHLQQESFDCIFTAGERNILRVPQVPLLPSSGSKANVGCYEYHFLMKGIDKSCFLVVQVVLVGKKMYERNRPIIKFSVYWMEYIYPVIWPRFDYIRVSHSNVHFKSGPNLNFLHFTLFVQTRRTDLKKKRKKN